MNSKELSPHLQLLERLVLIDSGTENISGVSAVQEVIAEECEKIGMKVSRTPNPKGAKASADLLVAEYVGEKDDWVTLVSHADTVFELDSGFQGFKLDHDGTWATGPGVIDNKGGVVVALVALGEILKTKPQLSYRFVVSPNEELGSIGFHDELKRIGLTSKVILGMEPAFEDGAFVNRRQGNKWYKLRIVGREAHSGREHREGINAAHEFAAKVSELIKLTDYAAGTTVSIGRVEGGQDKYNIVCGELSAKIDLRFENSTLGEIAHKKIETILSSSLLKNDSGESAQCSFEVVDDCPPYTNSSESDKLAEAVLKLIQEEESVACPPPKQGAAADTSYMAHPQAIVLDGLGVRGGGMHQSSERVLVESLESRSRVCARLLAHIDSTNV